MTDETPMAKCRNCDAPVHIRRPSYSGAHFCSLVECQRAKQRFFYKRRRDGVALDRRNESEIKIDWAIGVLSAVVHGPRVTCEMCGRTDAVHDLIHPALEEWSIACPGTVVTPAPPGMATRVARAIWPQP